MTPAHASIEVAVTTVVTKTLYEEKFLVIGTDFPFEEIFSDFSYRAKKRPIGTALLMIAPMEAALAWS